MVSASGVRSGRRVSRLLGAASALSAGVAAVHLLFPDPLADAFFAAWVVTAVGLALVGGLAAWTGRTPLIWTAALLLTGLSVVGMWSIGLSIAPAALFLLGSALLSRWAGPREGVREAVVADPPTVPEAVAKTLAGTASVAAGGSLVYLGAVAEDLFGACASETVACAIGKTNWNAVAVTLVGLSAVGVGGWLVWKQVYAARVLASTDAG